MESRYQFWADEISSEGIKYLKAVYPEDIPDICLTLPTWGKWCKEHNLDFDLVKTMYLKECERCARQKSDAW